MANSFTQIYVHYIWAVKGRRNFLIQKQNRRIAEIHYRVRYKNRECKMLAINSMPDHVHMFIGQHPSYSIAKIAQEIKVVSSKFINEKTGIDTNLTGNQAMELLHIHIRK